MKQFSPWRVRQLEGGLLEWTSPLGNVYIDHPPLPVTFLPEPAAHRGVSRDDDGPPESDRSSDPPEPSNPPF